MITIKRGLDIPISGEPTQQISTGNEVKRVGLVSDDYNGMKPTMLVSEGDRVKLGQPVFLDKKNEGVQFVAPGAGTVVSVNRGAKRRFLSLIIDLDGSDEQDFPSYDGKIDSVSNEDARKLLVDSGMWTALRTRPYSKTPAIDSNPHSIFVTAIDTDPLSFDPKLVIDEHKELFVDGLKVLTRIFDGPIHLCTAPGANIPGGDVAKVEVAEFAGPHPAGLVGTHIHFLDPVGPSKQVWHIGYQDVIAYGHLFRTGKLMTERVVALSGPRVSNPRLIRTRLGADLGDLVAGETEGEGNRIVSGSVLFGRKFEEVTGFLGRFHRQICVLQEGTERVFLGWQKPGFDKFSVTRVFASAAASSDKRFDMTTSTEGSKRTIVPIGSYEKVMPLDILPTYLLRSLVSGDTERAQQMGALELDEEDLALCTFVCPAKYEYGSILRENLTRIEKEG